MKNKAYNLICEKYQINPIALEQIIIKDNSTIKALNHLEVLQVIFIYSPDLFYCRGAEDKTVEYYDNNLIEKFLSDMKALSDDKAQTILYKKSLEQSKEIIKIIIDDLVFSGFSSKIPIKKLKKQLLDEVLKAQILDESVYKISIFIVGYLYGKKLIDLELFNKCIDSYEVAK